METQSRTGQQEGPEQRWVNILTEYLPKCGMRFLEKPNVLNIGCGNNVKWNYLAVAIYVARQGLGLPFYVGVDLKKEPLAQAKQALGELANFVVGDARNLTRFLRGTYQLALFEHPDISTSPEGPETWRRIFRETAQLMDRSGCIILTSFWLNDIIPAKMALERTRYNLVYSGGNKFPGKQFDAGRDGEPLRFDQYIIVAKPPL
jgi:hypothetical protein